MAEKKWTKDQEKVIHLRNRNILVSAAAGSGKTAALVERIITKVTSPEHPVDIDRLLVVTFTEAAAREMRERIGKAIEEKLEEFPDSLHLQKQEALLRSAQITTIHSFCLGVIRNYFNTIDLDPSFRIGDETELKLLKSDVLSELMEERYEEGKEEFYRFIETYATGKSDSGIEDMIFSLHNFAMSYPWPKQWMEQQRAPFLVEGTEGLEQTAWMGCLMEDVWHQMEDFSRQYEELAKVANEPDGPYMYAEVIEQEKEAFFRLSQVSSYGEMGEQIRGFSWERLPSKRDSGVNADKRELVKEWRNQIKKELEKIKGRYFYQTAAGMAEDMGKVKEVMDVLIDLAISFTDRYQQKKEEKGVVDFHDLEHFALQILLDYQEETGENKPTAVARELQEVYEEILIDEYQDSNYVQEAILTSVSKVSRGEPNIFMVGDVKQSIYKFRLARPELFMEKYGAYSLDDSLYQKVNLQRNFRSRDVVLSGINYIFEGIMKKELGNIAYDEAARLNPGADFPEDGEWDRGTWKNKFILVEQDRGEKELSAQEAEARAIAREIKAYMAGGMAVWDNGRKEYRRPSYGDMVILLRSPKSWTDKMAEVLKEEGIPAVANVQTGYFSALEVRTILNFLLAIDNPLQDIPFTGTLTSFIGNFKEAELGHIREGSKEETMYESLKRFAKENANGEQEGEQPDGGEKARLAQRCGDFLELLGFFRQLVPYTSVYGIIQQIYEKTKIYDYVSVLPGGSVRKANLDMLLERAVAFESTSYGGLFHFNRYMERLHEYNIDFGEAGASEGKEDVVPIMSIHKSKGLEFPIVFLAGMFKNFNQQDSRSRLALHPDLGIGPDLVDYELRTKMPTLLKKVIQRQLELENLGEELRVLYVALTRAKEKLVMTGSGRELNKKLEKWRQEKEGSYQMLTQAGSYGDWAGPRIMAHLALCQDRAAQGEDLPANRENQEELFEMELLSEKDLVVEEVYESIGKEARKEQLLHWAKDHPLSKQEKAELSAYMNFVYPYKEEEKIKSKLSVSELKRLHQREEEDLSQPLSPEEEEAYIPDFAREEEVTTGAGRGTIYHKVMESLAFKGAAGERQLRQQLAQLEKDGAVLPEERKFLDIRKISHFLASSLGKRMAKAEERNALYREQPFVMGVPAKDVDESIDSQELVLVQGMIDAYFEEGDALVLMDYKTDRIEGGGQLAERYKAQLGYYQKALEQLTGKAVKEKWIYSFYLEEAILVEG